MADTTTTVNFASGSGTFTVPAKVTELSVEMIGGGGGGGYSGFLIAAGGGGGGAYTRHMFAVVPGETLSYDVGSGGAGGSSDASNAGGAGGNTQMMRGSTVLARAAGGSGGTKNAAGPGGLAANGTGDVKTSGSNGDQAGGRNGYGGAGASGGTLTGGAQKQPSASAGNPPGGGGSSGGTNSPYNGGAGAVGYLRITYTIYEIPAIGRYLKKITEVGASRWRAPYTGKVLVQAMGAGGGGRGGVPLSTGGAGGGGGAYADKTIDVIEAEWYDVVVGTGGIGGTNNGGTATDGGDTTFSKAGTVLVRAKGGKAATSSVVGAGGSATDSVGDVKNSGFSGLAPPSSSQFNAGTGGSGAFPFGGQGSQYSGQGAGTAGTAPGGAGSGGGHETSGHGGNGAIGEVRVAYVSYMGDVVIDGKKKLITGFQRVLDGAKINATLSVVKNGVAVPAKALIPDLDARLKPYPVWLPAGQEELFNRQTGVFNWAVGAPNLRAALAAGTVNWTAGGNSITEGFTFLNDQLPYNFTADRANSYPVWARNEIASLLGIPIAGTGLVRIRGGAGGTDPRWALNTTADYTTHKGLNETGASATFNSNLPGTNAAVVLIPVDGASATISIDGATSGPGFLNWTSSGTLPVRLNFSGLANTNHEVKITRVAGSVRVVGADVFNSTGIKVNNIGHGGATALGTEDSSWSATSTNYLDRLLPLFYSNIYGSTPHVFSWMLGTNDLNGSNSSGWGGSYDNIRNAVQFIGETVDGPNTDIILLTPPHFSPTIHSGLTPSIPHYQRLMALALAKGWAVIDTEWLTGGYEPLRSQGYTGDNFGHLSTSGATDTGKQVGRAMLTTA